VQEDWSPALVCQTLKPIVAAIKPIVGGIVQLFLRWTELIISTEEPTEIGIMNLQLLKLSILKTTPSLRISACCC
jgi:hypothetical protein